MSSYFRYSFRLLIVLLACGLSSRAQQAQVTARLDSTSMSIGQQTMLHFFVHAPAKQPVTFPVIADSIVSKLQVVRLAKTDTIPDKDAPGMQTIRRNYLITSFDEGSYTIPPFSFKVGNDVLQSDQLSLQVNTVKVDTTKAIYDIKQPLAVSYSFLDWLRDHWLWVLIPMLIIAAIIGLISYFRKRPASLPVPEAPKPGLPFHVIALNQLHALRDKKLWQMDHTKAYYSELSDIVRAYVEARYAVKTHEKTTDEIFASLKHAGIASADWSRLQQVLVLADLVKFAKERPLPTDNEQSMDNALAFVTATQPVIPPVTKGGNADGVV